MLSIVCTYWHLNTLLHNINNNINCVKPLWIMESAVFDHLRANFLLDRPVVKFRHCGKDIYRFSDENPTLHPLGQTNQSVCERNRCPVCHERPVLRLLEAPIALLSPFTNGHKVSCAFLIGAHDGPSFLGEWHETELHVGVSDSKGLVHNYTLSGVQKDLYGWEQCVSIQLVPPWRDALSDLWDKELQLFSSQPTWGPERFDEEREFGSCCYGFALEFINHMRSLDGKRPLSRNEFTSTHVLPRMKYTSMFIKVYEEILQHGFCIVDK